MIRAAYARVSAIDPRHLVLGLLLTYLTLGVTVLGFNRSPAQIVLTILSAMVLEVAFHRLLKKEWIFPWSACITGCGLSILLDYSRSHVLLLVPVMAAIGSKYFFTFKGRHAFNPALFGVVFSLFFSRDLISSAPAYQWYGLHSMAFFLGAFALILFMPKINRWQLVLSFLLFFTLQTALRAWIMRHHLPFTTLFWGTLSSPPFLLFTFYMITDPRTSPQSRRDQWLVGFAIATLDLFFHLFKSYYTFFYAAFVVAATRFAWFHLKAAWYEPSAVPARVRGWAPGFAVVGGLTALMLGGVRAYAPAAESASALGVRMTSLDASATGIAPAMGDLYGRLDPRVQHIAKWILGVGDAVAVGDIDRDGRVDLFFTFPLKADGDRCALYLNRGAFRFERAIVPELAECAAPEKFGIPTNALMQDYDGDGWVDLLITRAFGRPMLLRNTGQEGRLVLENVSTKTGLANLWRSTIGATYLDANRDGRLDLFLANPLPEYLPDFETPTRLNLFDLPQPAYADDRRMFHFMHASWHNATNGGQNDLLLQDADGRFVPQDMKAWGLDANYWSLAVGSVDFNKDGFKDLYVANDFGPDEYYLNDSGRRFERVTGAFFGSVGRDTYKGMNVSIADYDRNGWQDVYVSNVHHDLQAEGSLLWAFSPNPADPRHPLLENRALPDGALNERRFGWGASFGDIDNDGWLDLAQANGMVDDTLDRTRSADEKCPDYWYINEKVARSPPSYHAYADKWGDIRGLCIHGEERNRLYLNRGRSGKSPRFVDVARAAGLDYAGTSRGASLVDLDNDGRLDLVFTHMFKEPTIYRNDSATKAGFLFISLIAKQCHASGHGSIVQLEEETGDAAVAPQVRELQSAHGFEGQSDPRLHFGLGNRTGEQSVIVDWCGNGDHERFAGLEPNRLHILEQGRGQPVGRAYAR